MPAYMRKLPNKYKWRVYSPSGKVHAKATSKKKAEAQIRLLNGVSHGMELRNK